MATKPGEIKLKKKRKRKSIPEVEIQLKTTRTYEVVCPECKEVVKDSIESYQTLTGEYICEGCGEKFKAIITRSKKDGRGAVHNKEIARNNILRVIRKSGPISAKSLREEIKLNKVATRKILTNLEEEGLIKHIPKGWILVG